MNPCYWQWCPPCQRFRHLLSIHLGRQLLACGHTVEEQQTTDSQNKNVRVEYAAPDHSARSGKAGG